MEHNILEIRSGPESNLDSSLLSLHLGRWHWNVRKNPKVVISCTANPNVAEENMSSCYNSVPATLTWSKEWEYIQKQTIAKTILAKSFFFFAKMSDSASLKPFTSRDICMNRLQLKSYKCPLIHKRCVVKRSVQTVVTISDYAWCNSIF